MENFLLITILLFLAKQLSVSFQELVFQALPILEFIVVMYLVLQHLLLQKVRMLQF